MSRQTSHLTGDAPTTSPGSEILHEVKQIADTMNHDPHFIKEIAAFNKTRLVLSATDTGRELLIELDKNGARVHAYNGGKFDVKIRATEETHRAVLYGQMDADAAFFAGAVRIVGSIATAFRVKNRFLGLLWPHLRREPGVEPRRPQTAGLRREDDA